MAQQKICDVMTPNPIQLPGSASIADAASRMREADVGNVIVQQNGMVRGIVTDRDIVVRVVGAGRDVAQTRLEDICSPELVTASPEDDVDRVIASMREHAIRRVPVLDERGQAVGIVSLGDLAQNRDSQSVLGRISAAPPNQ
jgi:CBS domain-containing protein